MLGIRFGAMGVAAGTMVGSVVSILAHIIYDMPRTHSEIALRAREFVLSGLLPLCATLPLGAVAVYSWKGSQPSVPVFAAAALFSLLLSAVLLMQGFGGKYVGVRS